MMRPRFPVSRIGAVQIHPSLHLDLAREQQEDLDARAERDRVADALRPARPRFRFARRAVALIHSAVQSRRVRRRLAA